MQGLDFEFPEGMLTPEEMARFIKFKSDATQFYEKQGDNIEWLEQAQELGLMEIKDWTPDDRQFTEAVANLFNPQLGLFSNS